MRFGAWLLIFLRKEQYMTYGTSRANAYRILEDTLNLRDIRIYDTV